MPLYRARDEAKKSPSSWGAVIRERVLAASGDAMVSGGLRKAGSIPPSLAGSSSPLTRHRVAPNWRVLRDAAIAAVPRCS